MSGLAYLPSYLWPLLLFVLGFGLFERLVLVARERNITSIADFINPAGLQSMGNNLFQETAASGAPQVGTPGLNGFGTTLQNTLETSNVSTVEEMVNMITTQRAYEMNSKVISTADQMLSFVTQNL